MNRQSFMSKLLYGVASVGFRFASRLTVVGRENIPMDGSVIIAANHTHNMDPAVIGAVMPWPVKFLAKRELVTEGNACTRWLVRTWGMIPIRRDRVDREALRMASEYLDSGGAIGMFPEGTRSRASGMAKARPGTAFLSVATGAPVLPVSIEGLAGLGHNPLRALRRPRLTVRVGPLLEFGDGAGSEKAGQLERVTDEIMGAIAGLLPHHMRGYYEDSG